MENISLPNFPLQDIYYLKQLSVYTFAVHNNKNETATFYLYHEGITQNGSNAVWHINDYVLSTIDELDLYSDNCIGQSKTKAMIIFIMALTVSGRFKKLVFQSVATCIYLVIEVLT